MSIGIAGNYILRMKFGTQDIPIDPGALHTFSIVQDINRLLPSFVLEMTDSSGLLTHFSPFDKSMNRISVEISTSQNMQDFNIFNFHGYKKTPIAIYQSANRYMIEGLLNTPNVFNPTFCRGSFETIKSFVEKIATDELLADKVEVSQGLSVEKNILQPNWSNAQLLKYLRDNVGDEYSYSYHPFFYVKDGVQTFAFKSLEEMCGGPVENKFIMNDVPYQDYSPITDYEILDTYNVIGMKGIQSQKYGYYDYWSGQYVDVRLNYSDYLCLSDYLLCDLEDSSDSQIISDTGRSNEFTYDFLGKVKGEYYSRLNNLSKMWITTWGKPNVVPGTVARVLFLNSLSAENIFQYQYSGNWLVERVVHSFSDTFITRLLLTRAGIDTSSATSLVPAIRRAL